ncbi:uncharacterized protein LOC113280039 [Papaver somniferum]|uniref:uncharacterized protein LOC113280039 n=1 Tax=Papaver somniferum TaxID=3469 RepID=UPI000E6FEFFB|nr:uncharacterized protein LOC113280039 [Papaver somniferum]
MSFLNKVPPIVYVSSWSASVGGGLASDYWKPKMDRSWIRLKDRTSDEYVKGIQSFMAVAKNYTDAKPEKTMSMSQDEASSSMQHNEEPEPDEMFEMIDSLSLPIPIDNGSSGEPVERADANNDHLKVTESILGLLEEARRELHPGCSNMSSLNFLVKFMHIKVLNHMSIKAFNMVLKLLNEAFPSASIPATFYDAKKVLKHLGLGYETIDVCKYDCALFWKEHSKRDDYPVCSEPRYIFHQGKGKKVAQKVLPYFPLKPRLQRLFMSKHTASAMRWHKDRHKDKRIETEDILRIQRTLKGGKILMARTKAPGKDIDVYLRPLIDELKELWEVGADTFDASTGKSFQMHAAVILTINDFPAFGNLSGWSTKGYKACPVCNSESSSQRLRSKIGYLGHRRFLPRGHSWRRSKQFNGKSDLRPPPKELNGYDIVNQLEEFKHVELGKNPNRKSKKESVVLVTSLIGIFPPAFFDVMVHLAVHLPHEAQIAGPVNYNWMYPIERFIGSLKRFVKNKARPECSIAEGYIVKESLTYFSMYLRGIGTKFNREERNNDTSCDGHGKKGTSLPVFSQTARPISGTTYKQLSKKEIEMAHWYLLNNCDELRPYLDLMSIYINDKYKNSQNGLNDMQVLALRDKGSADATDELYSIACGPDSRVKSYSGCIVNGVRFFTKSRDDIRTTQNSGLVVEEDHEGKHVDFYGILSDIIELQWYKDDPFVLAVGRQTQQVFYLDDYKFGSNWKVAERMQHRNLWDVPELEEVEEIEETETYKTTEEAYQNNEVSTLLETVEEEDLDAREFSRHDAEAEVVDTPIDLNDNFIYDVESDEEDETAIEYIDSDVEVILSDDEM